MTDDPRPPAASSPPPSTTTTSSSVRRLPESIRAAGPGTLASTGEVRPVLRPIPGWVIAVGIPVMLLVAVGAVWLMFGIGVDGTKLEVIRTGGTLGVGLGGVLVLWLGIRRQRSTELDLLAKYEAHELAERTAANTLAHQEQVAADARADAASRRITELYTKAAELLGSDKAPVRLSGLYALERLARDNESQRQTIVNVLCAYLRMPFSALGSPPEDDASADLQEEYRKQLQEREVRIAAQRLLAQHLQPAETDSYWGSLTLDLAGAQLFNFMLTEAHVRAANFDGATFTGGAIFDRTTFESCGFRRATFNSDVWFTNTTFVRHAMFKGAAFAGNTFLEKATLQGQAFAPFTIGAVDRKAKHAAD
ncbi:pentapeptide repeat-containing protein [Amycolatopsis sp. BJA-103]|uniref:pentapeptide repeat-containing protein n=1 Tax=Amycolatopsis sp. BJA-103 TaxID=1911175 RepID=UPI001304F703|nr:pentapeptide repeat-containing protein [Amycolatopsis sp. BJA-103]